MKAHYVGLHYENSAQTIVSFRFKPLGTYRYEAGQYAVVTIPHDNPDIRGTSRTMTLSSSPNQALLTITMRVYKPPDAGSSYKRALLALQPGAEVTFFDAMGDLVLPLDTAIPLVCIAGGVGIASFVGMMQWLVANHEQRPITLLYSVAEPGDIVLQQPFTDYARLYPMTRQIYVSHRADIPDQTTIVSTADGGPSIIRRRLAKDDIVPFIKADSLVYISGTEPMVERIRSDLQSAGISHQQIIFDYFEGYNDV